jgi:hypothetical protein
MIIDSSYFLNKTVFIPNAVAQPSIGSNAPSAINNLIGEIYYKEKELLTSILGYAQYLELASQFVETAGVWDWISSPLQKWVDLVDGKDNWNGLRYTIGENKISLIANYVYCHYLEQDYLSYTTSGVVVPKSENAMNVNPTQKITIAWNDFVKKLNGSCNYNNTNSELSLLDFMSLNNVDYDLSFFEIRTVRNSLGL